MDIKKEYFELAKKGIEELYEKENDDIQKAAELLGNCMKNNGVVQLFGVNHGEEVVNELNFRAGGLAPYHGLKPMELALAGKIDRTLVDTGEIYETTKYVDDLFALYKLDPSDAYVITSFYGNEPMAVEIARRAKKEGHLVISIVNKASYDKAIAKYENGKKLLDYSDHYIDMCAKEEDIALTIHGYSVGQLSSVYANIIAQMLTAEIFNWFEQNNLEAPVLLSANLAGADKHNNALTDKYEGRVR